MNVNYIALSIPVFFILMGIELLYSLYKKLNYYRLDDSLSNLSQGIGSQLVDLFMKGALFWAYLYVFEYWRWFNIPETWWTWVLLFVGVDFFYYWFHRYSHQINALWAAHVVHHQSEEYNLSVALRQSWFQSWFSWIFYLPLAFLGFNPLMFVTVSAFNTLYQFWIHTKAIKTMGFLEYFLNTPSHHRVHHGSNPEYIDKNHGGTLIIWDRLFGTFQKEEADVAYGITSPLASWNPVWANFHYWASLFQKMSLTESWKEKCLLFFKSPGWQPKTLLEQHAKDEVTSFNYHTPADRKSTVYALVLFVLGLLLAIYQLMNFHRIDFLLNSLLAAFVLWCLLNYGALLERKKWQVYSEFARLVFAYVLLIIFYLDGLVSLYWGGAALVLQLLMIASFINLNTKLTYV